MKLQLGIVSPVILVLCFSAGVSFGADAAKPSPEDCYKQAVANAEKHAKDGGTGEEFCWHTAYSMGEFVTAYKAWQEPAWLDAGVKYYDYAISKMNTGPDGYKGWIGPASNDLWNEVHVGNAVILNHLLDFAEVVLKDEALKKTYGEAANRYVALVKRDFVEKWDARGTWHEDGPYGAYSDWDTFCNAGDLKSWKKHPEANQYGLSLPFNMQVDTAQCLLKLYRITGDKNYRGRAQKIFAFMKSRMLLAGDYYVWNYWEPFGPWDVDLEKKDTRHWMNVHGYRNYQAGEIVQIVEAYNTGVVFDQQDIERILNTNLEVMWNKDKTDPKFVNSNALLPEPELTPEQKKALAEEEAKNTYAKEGRAGCLWTALLPFNQTIRDLNALKPGEAIAKAYFENVTLKSPPGFARLYAELPVTVFERPFSVCKSLTVAAVMPQQVSKGKPSIVLCKARIPVEIEVAVYSADGKTKQQVLFQGQIPGGADGHAGIFILQWDGGDPAGKVKLDKGGYRIRWTVPDGYREFPVVIAN